jgi:hypothetical protein
LRADARVACTRAAGAGFGGRPQVFTGRKGV